MQVGVEIGAHLFKHAELLTHGAHALQGSLLLGNLLALLSHGYDFHPCPGEDPEEQRDHCTSYRGAKDFPLLAVPDLARQEVQI